MSGTLQCRLQKTFFVPIPDLPPFSDFDSIDEYVDAYQTWVDTYQKFRDVIVNEIEVMQRRGRFDWSFIQGLVIHERKRIARRLFKEIQDEQRQIDDRNRRLSAQAVRSQAI